MVQIGAGTQPRGNLHRTIHWMSPSTRRHHSRFIAWARGNLVPTLQGLNHAGTQDMSFKGLLNTPEEKNDRSASQISTKQTCVKHRCGWWRSARRSLSSSFSACHALTNLFRHLFLSHQGRPLWAPGHQPGHGGLLWRC